MTAILSQQAGAGARSHPLPGSSRHPQSTWGITRGYRRGHFVLPLRHYEMELLL